MAPKLKSNIFKERIYRFLFGNDIFVSYARQDAEDYALTLTARLTNANYLCYLDQLGSRPGGKLPEELKTTLRRSTVFVLVGTEAATGSDGIEEEITEFLKTSRPIIPIDFNGALVRAKWYPLIKGIALKRVISEGARPSDRPSASTVRRIGDSFNYTRRNEWLRVLLLSAIAIFAVTVIGSGAIVATATSSAWDTEINSAMLTLSSRISADVANHEREQAEALTAVANEQRANAQRDAAIASAKAIEETERARQAEEKKQAALAEANKQEKIATAHQLANRAVETLKQKGNLLSRSVLYAVESVRRFDDLGLRSLDADSAIREGLLLLPNLERSFRIGTTVFENVAITRNGRYIAAESLNGVILFDVLNNSTINFPMATTSRLNTNSPFLFSSDGKYLVVVEEDLSNLKSITHVLSTTTGREVAPPIHHSGRIKILALSEDGELLAVGFDKQVQVVETIRGTPVSPVFKNDRQISTVVFGPEKPTQHIAIGTDAGVQIRNLRDSSQKPTDLKDEGVNGIIFSNDGKYLAVVASRSLNKTIRVWDWSLKQIPPFVPPIQYSTILNVNVCFSPDGKYLATSSGSDPIRILNLGNGEIRNVNNAGFVRVLAFISNTQLATAGVDNTARIWNVTNGHEMARFYHDSDLDHEFSVVALAFSSDGNHVITVSSDHTVRMWGVAAGEPVTRTEHKEELNAIAFSPNGRYFATAESNLFNRRNAAIISDAKTGREISRIDSHQGAFRTIAFDPTGKFLITGSADKTLCVWDEWNINPPRKVICHSYPSAIESFAPSFDGQHLAVALRNKTLLILEKWSTASVRTVTTINHPDRVSSVAFSPKEGFVATGCQDGFARIWKWKDDPKQPIANVKHGPIIEAVSFSADGQYLATAGFRREAYVWNWTENTSRPTAILQHESAVWSLSFDPSGRYLATASSDQTTRIWINWTTSHPSEVARLSDSAEVTGVTFSRSGEYLGTINSNRNAQVWLWQPRDLIRQACALLKRNMTKEEWNANLYNEAYRRTCKNLPAPE